MLNTPVVYIAFNRPEHTRVTFEIIKKIKPKTLFIVLDGPRINNKEDDKKCEKVKEIVSEINWKAEIYQIFSEINLGCKKRITTGLDFVFKKVDKAIILEDDCLPNEDFFDFCEILLNKYEKNENISMISGSNFQGKIKRGKYSYYFSRYAHVWGWATWKRAWKNNNSHIDFWPKYKESQKWKLFFKDKLQKNYWENNFNLVYEKKFESTWDYPWIASIWFNGGITITPNVNLITNIGLGPESTHTFHEKTIKGNPTNKIGEIIHPPKIVIEYEAEKYTFDNEYGGKYKRFPIKYYDELKKVTKNIIKKIIKYKKNS